MKIAVISDTHGNFSGLKELYIYLREIEQIKRFIHLGHNFSDVEKAHLQAIESGLKEEETTFFSDLASVLLEDDSPLSKIRRIVQVAGANEEAARKGLAPLIEYIVLNGVITVAVHDIKNLTGEDIQNGYLFLHGATHIPQIEVLSGRLFVNPGHFSLLEKSRQTYALLEITDEAIKAQIRYEDHSVKEEKSIKIKRSRKIGIR